MCHSNNLNLNRGLAEHDQVRKLRENQKLRVKIESGKVLGIRSNALNSLHQLSHKTPG